MKRVLTARFMDETNTFSRVMTDLAENKRASLTISCENSKNSGAAFRKED